MTITLNHIIVPARDRREAGRAEAERPAAIRVARTRRLARGEHHDVARRQPQALPQLELDLAGGVALEIGTERAPSRGAVGRGTAPFRPRSPRPLADDIALSEGEVERVLNAPFHLMFGANKPAQFARFGYGSP